MVSRGLQIDHLTAVVTNVDEAAEVMSRLLGEPPSGQLRLPSMEIRTFSLGHAELHVNAPTGLGVVHDHHERYGPSIHHLALRVEDLDAHLVELRADGFRTSGEPVETAPGVREVFLDPATTAGLWIQLVERTGLHVTADHLDAGVVEQLANQTTTTATKK